MNKMNKGDILNRADKVNFMDVENTDEKFTRMHGFTDGGKSSNANTYDRRYIDEETERSDVTGYGTEIAYAFDEMVEDPVHKVLVEVAEDEIRGKKVTIVTVDFSKSADEGAGKKFEARKRVFSVIPDASGDSTDAYTYSGTFKAAGKIIKGTATTEDDWETCSFTEAEAISLKQKVNIPVSQSKAEK